MKALKIKHRQQVQPLTPAALDSVLADKLQARILELSIKFQRARNKYVKWKLRQQVSDLRVQLNELCADTSIKLTN